MTNARVPKDRENFRTVIGSRSDTDVNGLTGDSQRT